MLSPRDTPAHDQWRAVDFLDPQQAQADDGRSDIDNGVDRAYFVEVDLLRRDAVGVRFRFR